MIEVKDAVDNAIHFLKEIRITELPNLKVEEVYLEKDKYIIVTLGWDEERSLTPLEKMTKPANTPFPTERIYKSFYIDNDNGKVEKMKIRKVNNG
ncbi:MAG: hypothetical protein FWH29_04535 [Methanobrevibacter sp.]|nr:hypothetical protein [Methanobrevibacter sp.]